ncbi:MAG: hypothetical protein LBT09_04210 [Planctomycetaceae bacterium]|nr:hypothetical protein [Planctomycetaceae bacterium]
MFVVVQCIDLNVVLFYFLLCLGRRVGLLCNVLAGRHDTAFRTERIHYFTTTE